MQRANTACAFQKKKRFRGEHRNPHAHQQSCCTFIFMFADALRSDFACRHRRPRGRFAALRRRGYRWPSCAKFDLRASAWVCPWQPAADRYHRYDSIDAVTVLPCGPSTILIRRVESRGRTRRGTVVGDDRGAAAARARGATSSSRPVGCLISLASAPLACLFRPSAQTGGSGSPHRAVTATLTPAE